METKRTILIHVNAELPAESDFTADQLVVEILACIEVAREDPNAMQNVPAIVASSGISISLAEEV